jgi:hypothetical protein
MAGDDASGKGRPKRTPTGTKRVFGFLAVALALALLYYINVVLPESAWGAGSVRGGGGAARASGAPKGPMAPPSRTLTAAEVQKLVDAGPPTGVGSVEDPPRKPNEAICNESVLEGVLSVARQQSSRATAMYEDERRRRERQDTELEALRAKLEKAETELAELKAAKPA